MSQFDRHHKKVIKSEVDPDWSVVSFDNGYYFARTANLEFAIVRGYVPTGVRKELDAIASARMK